MVPSDLSDLRFNNISVRNAVRSWLDNLLHRAGHDLEQSVKVVPSPYDSSSSISSTWGQGQPLVKLMPKHLNTCPHWCHRVRTTQS
jgi:hypothetical protein